MIQKSICDGVSYVIVSFLIPNPQCPTHCIVVYVCIQNLCIMVGRKSIPSQNTEEYLDIFLDRYSRYQYRTRYWCNMT